MAAPNESILYNNNISTERLCDSIRGGEDVDTIQALLQKCFDIDARDSDGHTPLLLACLQNRKKIVHLLIEYGANIDVKSNIDEYTVLHYASKNGWVNIVWTLIKKMPDLNARDIRGDSAMHHASRSGCLTIVKCLVEEGAHIDLINFKGETPLLCAVQRSWIDVVKLLLNSGANVDGHEGMLLYYASRNGWKKLVKSFVKRVPDLNESHFFGDTALHIASKCGRLEIVKCLLEEGIDINKRNNLNQIALHNASSAGHAEIVKWLVEKGSDINATDKCMYTALHNASSKRHLEIVKYLVGEGININTRNVYGFTAVHEASIFGYLEVVKCIVEKGININTRNTDGETAVHVASTFGHLEVVKRNCDLDARTTRGNTALGLACKKKNWDIVQYLLQVGASCDIVDENGYSPLNYVCMTRKPEFKYIKLLIENGAYLMPDDFDIIVSSPLLTVLEDVKLCCRTILNKFNNRDLPQLHKLPASRKLPRIEEMKIVSGSMAAQAIKRTVGLKVQTNGFCNIFDVRPMVLSVISVRSVLEYSEKIQNCKTG